MTFLHLLGRRIHAVSAATLSRRGLAIVLGLAAAIALTAGAGCTAQAKKARRLAKANEYFDAGDFAKAEIEYRNVLQIVPLDPDAISRLSVIFFDQGRNGLSAAYLTKAHELQPENLEVNRRLATFDNAAGKTKEARDLAMSVLARQPTDEQAPLVVANSARQPKEIEEVRKLLQALPSAGGAPVLSALAGLALREGKVAEAEALLHRAEALQPNSALVALSLGAVAEAKKDLEAARKNYANAASLAPARSPAPLRYAEFLLRSGKQDEARKILDEVAKKTPDFLPVWLLIAQIAEFQKKADETLAAVGKILALDNVHHDAWLLSARAHLAKGEVAEALSELERLEKAFPKSPELQYELAVAFAAKGEVEKAITALNQALAVAPDAMGANMLLAGLYIRTGSPALAVKLLTPLTKKFSQAAQARLMLAQAHRAQGNLDEALNDYAQIEKDFRANPQIGYNEGLVYLQQNKVEEARRAFNKSLAIAPNEVPVVEQLVNIDLAQKKFPAAQERVDALIAQNGKSPELYLLRAKAFAASGDVKQEEAALQRVVELSPDSPVGYMLLAQLYLRSKDNEKALGNLQQSVAKNPKNVQAIALIAAIYEQQKNFKGAKETYEKILTINPKLPLILNNLAFLDAETFNELDKALPLAQDARQLAPNSPDVADTLGWILFKKRDYARALPLLAESGEKVPANPNVQYHLGMTAYMMGNETQARTALEAAIKPGTEFAGIADARQALTILTMDPKTGGPSAQATLEKAVADRADPIAMIRLGGFYEQAGATDKASASYEAALKASPGSVSAAMGMIRIHMLRKDTAKALELAKATRKLAPNDVELGRILGHLALSVGDRAWALGLLQETARKLPDDPQVQFDLADAAYSQGQVPAAEEALRAALAASPSIALASQATAILEMIDLAKDPAKAAAASAKVEQRLKADPSDVPALMALAAAQEKRGDAASAQKSYEKILARFEAFTPAQRNLTLVYVRTDENSPKAIEIATSARQAFPGDAELAKAFGILLVRQGNFSRASALLQESARKLTSDAETMYYLATAQAGLKDTAASARSAQKALELGLSGELAAKAKKMVTPSGKL